MNTFNNDIELRYKSFAVHSDQGIIDFGIN
jgi:hypothetical protein